MTAHNGIHLRRWLLLVLAVVLIASHAFVLRYALLHKSLSTAVVAAATLLVVVTHLGLLGRIYASFRRHSGQ